MAVTPFRIAVPDADLDDTRTPRSRGRAGPTRSRTRAGTTAHRSGTCRSWWRTGPTGSAGASAEQLLNSLPQFRATVDVAAGFEHFGLHFVHQPGVGPAPLPLVLATGGRARTTSTTTSSLRLANPGAFGDDPPTRSTSSCRRCRGTGSPTSRSGRGMTPRVMSTMFAALMRELGYDRFAAAGCDWGAYVTALLGLDHPDALVGIHMGMLNFRAARLRAHRRGRRVRRAGEGVAPRGDRATAPSRAPSRSRWRTGSWTRPPGWRGGSSRSGGAGPTATATCSSCSPATSCSPRSPSTGSPAPSTAPTASTTRAATTRSRLAAGERVLPPAGFLLEREVDGADAQHRSAAPASGRGGLRRAALDRGRPRASTSRPWRTPSSTSRSCGRSSAPALTAARRSAGRRRPI